MGCEVIVGGSFTVNVAALEVADAGSQFRTTQRYWLPLCASAAVKEYVADVAPAISLKGPPPVLTCHWYVSGVAPVAITVKLAVDPVQTVVLDGCEEIPGGEQPANGRILVTVSE